MNRKGKQFTFPRNVNKEYGVFKEYTIKDILTILLPTLMVGIVFIILSLPKSVSSIYDFIPLLLIIVILCIVLTIELAVITVKPIKERPNITVKYYMSVRNQYKHMQKLYFLKPKKERNR